MRSWIKLSATGVAMLALLVGGALAVAPPATAEPSRGSDDWSVEARDLLIETVTVEGAKRVSPELIVGESLLEDGRAYSEGELRAAAHRIHRLPFILDARLTLRKGSHRGAYELVIAVVESRRFFFGANLRVVSFASPLALEDGIRPTSVGLTEDASELTLSAGARWFTGAHGVVFAGVDDEGLRAGVVHYDLFDRHVFGSFQVAVGNTCCVQRVFPLGLDPALGRWNLQDTRQVGFELGVPLSAVRSIRIGLQALDGDESSRTEILGARTAGASRIFFGDGFEHWRLQARWVHDSTDDPVVPTRGAVVSGGLTAERLESRQTVQTFDTMQAFKTASPAFPVHTEALPTFESRLVALEALAVRHVDLTFRQTVSLSGAASVGRSTVENLLLGSELGSELGSKLGPERRGGSELLAEQDLTSYSASVAARWSLDLRQVQGLRSQSGDLRLELGVGYGWETTSTTLRLAGNPLEKMDLEVALVLRNGWGVFRLGLTYLDVGEVLR